MSNKVWPILLSLLTAVGCSGPHLQEEDKRFDYSLDGSTFKVYQIMNISNKVWYNVYGITEILIDQNSLKISHKDYSDYISVKCKGSLEYALESISAPDVPLTINDPYPFPSGAHENDNDDDYGDDGQNGKQVVKTEIIKIGNRLSFNLSGECVDDGQRLFKIHFESDGKLFLTDYYNQFIYYAKLTSEAL